MATTLSSPLPDPGGCLICQRLALAVVLVDLANTSKEIIRCFSITARFAGSHRSLRPDTARLPVQSVPVAIRQRHARHGKALVGVDLCELIPFNIPDKIPQRPLDFAKIARMFCSSTVARLPPAPVCANVPSVEPAR